MQIISRAKVVFLYTLTLSLLFFSCKSEEGFEWPASYKTLATNGKIPLFFEKIEDYPIDSMFLKIKEIADWDFIVKTESEIQDVLWLFDNIDTRWPLLCIPTLKENESSLFVWTMPSEQAVWTKSEEKSFKRTQFDDKVVFSANIDDNHKMFFAQYENLLIASSAAWRIEGALKGLEKEQSLMEKIAVHTVPYLSRPDADFYIITPKQAQLDSSILNSESKTLPFPKWSEFDANIALYFFPVKEKISSIYTVFSSPNSSNATIKTSSTFLANCPNSVTEIHPTSFEVNHEFLLKNGLECIISKENMHFYEINEEDLLNWVQADSAWILQTEGALFSSWEYTSFDKTWYAAIGKNCLFLSEEKTTLQNCIDAIIVGDILAKDKQFLEFLKRIPPEDKEAVFWKAQDGWHAWAANKSTYISAKGNVYFPLKKRLKKDKHQPTIAWKTQLDASAATPILKANSNLYFVQDVAGKLYALNEKGAILWTKQLSEFIQSEVFEIDYLGTGADFFLFNSKSKVYLIDRNGNTPNGFPLTFSTPFSTGLSIVHFEENESYSFLIPTENGDILGFDKDGRPLEGWNSSIDFPNVQWPIQHIAAKDGDYIFALSTVGKIAIFNRFGKARYEHILIGNRPISPLAIGLDAAQNPWATALTDDAFLIKHTFSEREIITKNAKQNKALDLQVFDASFKQSRGHDLVILNRDKLIFLKAKDFRQTASIPLPIAADTLFLRKIDENIAIYGCLEKKTNFFYAIDNLGRPLFKNRLLGETPFEIISNKEGTVEGFLTTVGSVVWCYQM